MINKFILEADGDDNEMLREEMSLAASRIIALLRMEEGIDKFPSWECLQEDVKERKRNFRGKIVMVRRRGDRDAVHEGS